jgi:hypothetical protein
MKSDVCLACGDAAVIEGRIRGPVDVVTNWPRPGRDANSALFLPDHMAARTPQLGIGVADKVAHCCARCGFVWMSLPRDAVPDLIRRQGDAIAKQHLEWLGENPSPNNIFASEHGRDVAARLSQVEELLHLGEKAKAARLYSKWTGRHPDDVRQTIRLWPTFALKNKLARLGWNSCDSVEAQGIVDEIDNLIGSSMVPRATSRYRGASGCSWDDAFKAINEWPSLDWEDRVARFGWYPPKPVKEAVEKSDKVAHPLWDRAIDG